MDGDNDRDLMAKTEPIQSEPLPSEWPEMPNLWWSWIDDLRLLLQGKQGRQNFINVLTNTKPNNVGGRTFFCNYPNGDAKFTSDTGTTDPYLASTGELIVPTKIIASREQILNTAAFRVGQSYQQVIPSATASVVTYDVATFDQDDVVELATGTATPIQAGIYWVHGAVGFAAADVVADCYVSCLVGKNSVILGSSIGHTSTTKDIVVSAGTLIKCNGTTDYLQMAVQHNFGVDKGTYGNDFTCYFEAYKVG